MSESTESENPVSEEAVPSSKKTEEGGAPSGAGLADLESIADDLSAGMPEVQEHAIEQEKAVENEKLAQYSHLKDSDGNSFNPDVHKTNKAGEPTLSTKGKLIKKPGRKPGSSSPGSASSSVVGGGVKATTGEQKAAEARMQARASGTMAANLILQIGIVTGGEEWQPRINESIGLDEKSMLENAFADYFEATGKTDIPPGMALTVAVGAYALPRFTMPQTQSRLAKLKTKIKQWWIDRKIKKHGLKTEPIKKESADHKMEA
jgi:hypothetical protein